jgi:hypothetical protein
MKLSSTAIAVVVVVAFAGGVLGAQVAGVWQTEGSKTPARLATGAFAGEYDPADIRGSYSFGDIGEAFEVPVSALAAAYGVGNTDNPEAILVKTLEEAFEGLHEELEIGTDSVRLFVAKYLDRPITVADSTGIPETAIPILEERGTVDPELLSRVVVLPTEATDAVAAAPDAARAPEEEEREERTIRGMTTFAELLGWGVAEEDLEAVFSGSIGPPSAALRDYAKEVGVEFSVVKDRIQALVDETQ